MVFRRRFRHLLIFLIFFISIIFLRKNSDEKPSEISTVNVKKTTISTQIVSKETSCDKSIDSYQNCLIYVQNLTHGKDTSNGIETYFILKKEFNETFINQSIYWNEDDRLKPFDKIVSSSIDTCQIIYCGANEVGTDGLEFLQKNPDCQIWFLEPVYQFYNKLIHSNKIIRLLKSGKHHFVNIGLSNKNEFLSITANDILESQAISLVNIKNNNIDTQNSIQYQVILRDIQQILYEFNILNKSIVENQTSGELNLLHMNCEGCEYDVIERLIKTNLIQFIRYIQFGSHRPYTIRQNINQRYCCLQQSLTKTHQLVFGIPWAWERWIRLDLL